jgi:hypothetical protein
VSLEELVQQDILDAAVDLLTLPVRSEPELGPLCRRILERRPDLEPVVFSMLFEWFPLFSREEILMLGGLPLQELRRTRAVQEILEEEGRLEGARRSARKVWRLVVSRKPLPWPFASSADASAALILLAVSDSVSFSVSLSCSNWSSWRKTCSISESSAICRLGSMSIPAADGDPPGASDPSNLREPRQIGTLSRGAPAATPAECSTPPLPPAPRFPHGAPPGPSTMWGGLKDWSRPLPERARGPAPPLLAHPPSGPEGPHRWGPTEIQKALRRVVLASALSRQRRDTAFLTPRGSVMLTRR